MEGDENSRKKAVNQLKDLIGVYNEIKELLGEIGDTNKKPPTANQIIKFTGKFDYFNELLKDINIKDLTEKNQEKLNDMKNVKLPKIKEIYKSINEAFIKSLNNSNNEIKKKQEQNRLQKIEATAAAEIAKAQKAAAEALRIKQEQEKAAAEALRIKQEEKIRIKNELDNIFQQFNSTIIQLKTQDNNKYKYDSITKADFDQEINKLNGMITNYERILNSNSEKIDKIESHKKLIQKMNNAVELIKFYRKMEKHIVHCSTPGVIYGQTFDKNYTTLEKDNIDLIIKQDLSDIDTLLTQNPEDEYLAYYKKRLDNTRLNIELFREFYSKHFLPLQTLLESINESNIGSKGEEFTRSYFEKQEEIIQQKRPDNLNKELYEWLRSEVLPFMSSEYNKKIEEIKAEAGIKAGIKAEEKAQEKARLLDEKKAFIQKNINQAEANLGILQKFKTNQPNTNEKVRNFVTKQTQLITKMRTILNSIDAAKNLNKPSRNEFDQKINTIQRGIPILYDLKLYKIELDSSTGTNNYIHKLKDKDEFNKQDIISYLELALESGRPQKAIKLGEGAFGTVTITLDLFDQNKKNVFYLIKKVVTNMEKYKTLNALKEKITAKTATKEEEEKFKKLEVFFTSEAKISEKLSITKVNNQGLKPNKYVPKYITKTYITSDKGKSTEQRYEYYIYKYEDFMPPISITNDDGSVKLGVISADDNKQGKPTFTCDELKALTIDPWEALDTLHNQRILHNDIKSGNMIFLVNKDSNKYDNKLTGYHLIDLGLALDLSKESGPLEWKGGFRGTRLFAHPSLLSDKTPLTFNEITDNYGMALTLYFIYDQINNDQAKAICMKMLEHMYPGIKTFFDNPLNEDDMSTMTPRKKKNVLSYLIEANRDSKLIEKIATFKPPAREIIGKVSNMRAKQQADRKKLNELCMEYGIGELTAPKRGGFSRKIRRSNRFTRKRKNI